MRFVMIIYLKRVRLVYCICINIKMESFDSRLYETALGFPGGFGDLGRMAVYFQGAGKHR